MSKPNVTTVNPLQTVVNQAAIRVAEAQYRLANLFTPYQWNPERVDFDRVEVFLDDPYRAFPQPTDGIKSSLDRITQTLAGQRPLLDALKSQGVEPNLSADQLFITAQANVSGNRANTAAYEAAA
jgi:hypothetical protein